MCASPYATLTVTATHAHNSLACAIDDDRETRKERNLVDRMQFLLSLTANCALHTMLGADSIDRFFSMFDQVNKRKINWPLLLFAQKSNKLRYNF